MTKPENSAQQIWLEQPVEGVQMSLEAIRKRATKFEHRIRWRNIREYVASAIAAALLGYFFATSHDAWSRVEYGLFLAGLAWIVVQLHRKGSAKRVPEGLDTVTTLTLYRAELERQRDAVRTMWSWYLAPLIPGFIVLNVGRAIESPHPDTWVRMVVMDAFVAAGFWFVLKMNARAAACLGRTIEELRGAEQGSLV